MRSLWALIIIMAAFCVVGRIDYETALAMSAEHHYVQVRR